MKERERVSERERERERQRVVVGDSLADTHINTEKESFNRGIE